MLRFSLLTVFLASIAGFSLLANRSADACYHNPQINGILSSDEPVDEKTIEGLRELGYTALDQLLDTKNEISNRLTAISLLSYANDEQQAEYVELTKQLERLTRLIDDVGGQRNCTTSRLFWHTDLEQALAESKATNKPVLSLRMLGKLTDEYSCANSRFFRTTLYSNVEISAALREQFVLHWRSVRPVPRITVDFGDGRKLERTITGNSAHYVLASNGQPLDCLPGLYGPGAFQAWLDRMVPFAEAYEAAAPAEQAKLLKQFHNERLVAVAKRLDEKMKSIHPEFSKNLVNAKLAKVDPPRAIEAAPVAICKGKAEVPILRAAFAITNVDAFEKKMNAQLWQKLADAHAGLETLDAASIAVIRNENPNAVVAARRAECKRIVEDPLVRLVQNFQRSILLDTVRNEYLLHRRIHEWFANGEQEVVSADVEALNKRVYAELFLTPDSDPWLGLKPANVYTALDEDGVSVVTKE